MNTHKAIVTLCAAVLIAGLVSQGAVAEPADHTPNLKQLAQVKIKMGNNEGARGSDLAFQGNLLVAGSYDGIGFFRILKRAPFLKQVSFYDCPSSQDDVSIWGDLLITSTDSPASNAVHNSACNGTDNSTGQEGIRFVDISNVKQPRQVKFVKTDCGSHTHTVVPAGKYLYVYVLSYPLGAPTATCNLARHRKISVIRVPKANPKAAKIVSTPDVSPAMGCHDVTIFMPRKLAIAACISESQIWSVKDPAHPKILAHIRNPLIQIHHQASITWDGKVIALGDEWGGGGVGGCFGSSYVPQGAMWFYDIKDPENPVLLGWHGNPRMWAPGSTEDGDIACTTHEFNLIPTKAHKYLAATSYYASGITIVDFTDPAKPKEVAHYQGSHPDTWSSYWYNGRIYTNDYGSLTGVGVYTFKGTTTKTTTHFFKTRLNPQLQLTNFQN